MDDALSGTATSRDGQFTASDATSELLQRTQEIATTFLAGVRDRRVGAVADYQELLDTLGGPLPEAGEEPTTVIERLARDADAGLVATVGPRYFGFVIGGVLPAAVAADWLTSAWDQHAFSFVTSPAAAAVEEITRRWLADLLGLSPDVSVGLVTGATMANFTGIAAGRHMLLEQVGWDVEEQGLFGAPPIAVVTSDESHATIFAALQMLGLGRSRVGRVATDAQGRLRADELRVMLRQLDGPPLVCAQAGNVNTGAVDPIAEIANLVHDAGGWLHVDGAFGAWAAASPRLRHLTDGLALADSLSVDAHKWLNVPYDCGFVFTRHTAAHRAAMSLEAAYYSPNPAEARANHHFVPESSRRARCFPVYAALRSLGRRGLVDLVERCSALAQRMADRLSRHARIRVLNDVVLNQVLVRIEPPTGDTSESAIDAFTALVVNRVQEDGTCWLGGSIWQGEYVMRIAISNWSTSEADIDRSADAIIRCST
jgi:glutamate/tyrosine decarboxylase-like PLP-dependent enzyme